MNEKRRKRTARPEGSARAAMLPAELVQWLDKEEKRAKDEHGYRVPRGVLLAQKILGPNYHTAANGSAAQADGDGE